MLLFFQITAILISTLLAYSAARKVLRYGINILLVSELCFYCVQVVPFIIFTVYNFTNEYPSYMRNVCRAMNDENTVLLYCLLIVVVQVFFHALGEKGYRKTLDSLRFSVRTNTILSVLMIFGIISPLIAMLLAPDKSVYLTFSYFYTNDYSINSIAYLYHTSVVKKVCNISLVFTLMFYFFNKGKNFRGIWTFVGVFLTVWADGKRAVLAFLLIGILLIDFVLGNRSEREKLLKKVAAFVGVVVIYFVAFSEITGKNTETSFFYSYEMYFSRMSPVMTAIYDQLNGARMLETPGMTLLFDFFVYIPRSVWENKPVLFTYYYTAYATGASAVGVWPSAFLVNIFVEYIANFGIFGAPIACLFLALVARISERSDNKYVYLVGLAFCCGYILFGFELIVMIAFYLWVALSVLNALPIKFSLRS